MVEHLPAVQETGFDPWVRWIPWGRAWQPTAVFLPGESQGQRSWAGYSPCSYKESDKTEQLTRSLSRTTDNILSMSFELFCRYWNPHQGEEVKHLLPTSMKTPDQLELEGWWYCLLITSPPGNQKVHALTTLCSLNIIQLLTTPSWVGHTVLRALACCGPLGLAK